MEYEEYDLCSDPDRIDELEAENALRQFDEILGIVEKHIGGEKFYLSADLVKYMNYLGIVNLHSEAGQYRNVDIRIRGSRHIPPGPSEIYMLVEDMCLSYNTKQDRDPIYLAAHCLWYLNWIHPFWNGNGRTARAICYLILCIEYNQILPGRTTVLAQIERSKEQYYKHLELADLAYSRGQINIVPLESYLRTLLTRQLDWP